MTHKVPRKLTFCCSGCGRTIRLPESAANKLLVCPGCGLRASVPPLSAATIPALKGSTGTRAVGGAAAASVLPIAPVTSGTPPKADIPPGLASPFMTLVAASGVLLAATLLVSVAALRQPRQNPLTETATPGPSGPAVDTVALTPDVPTPSSSRTTDHQIQMVELEGCSEAKLRDALQPLAAELKTLVAATADDPAAERRAALVRLRMYRLLCGLVEDDLVLDERLNEEAAAAAEVCRRLGHLTHEPPNPGLPADLFAKACRGAERGNLAFGMRDLVAAVDGWMDDSDADNVAALGHRRWCLNPRLRHVGFGRSARYFAMWAHDSSGSGRIPQSAICFPPPGCVPIDMFRPHYAWSVSLDPRVFQKPTPGLIRVTIKRPEESAGSAATAELDFLHIDTRGYGLANCIIFRPSHASTAVGSVYEVTLEGLRDHDGRQVRVGFVTQFVDQMSITHAGERP